jgi:hypothetical protein
MCHASDRLTRITVDFSFFSPSPFRALTDLTLRNTNGTPFIFLSGSYRAIWPYNCHRNSFCEIAIQRHTVQRLMLSIASAFFYHTSLLILVFLLVMVEVIISFSQVLNLSICCRNAKFGRLITEVHDSDGSDDASEGVFPAYTLHDLKPSDPAADLHSRNASKKHDEESMASSKCEESSPILKKAGAALQLRSMYLP